MSPKPHFYVLVAEDDADDSMLIKESIENTGAFSRIEMLRDGQELLDFMNAASPLPDIIISDINMPRKDGLEMLATLKADSRFSHIPVIIFSTSKSPVVRE